MPHTSGCKGLLLSILLLLLAIPGCTKPSHAQTTPAALQLKIKPPFRFVAYGDTRFHDPRDVDAANPTARQDLVQAIAQANPAFICFSGDIVLNGYDVNDWKVWDAETRIWREKKIPVYPALGNHDLHGNESVALGNYFEHFPDLKKSRYYSVQAGNALILALDSSQPEATGAQGEWLADRLDHVSPEVDFVFLLLHHPPYTSSSDSALVGGHSARAQEFTLAKLLEDRQARAHYRIVVFAGHVHNYERHEHGGVTYYVTGGGGAHPYPINRAPDDPFQGKGVNFHYLLVEVGEHSAKITMNRLDLSSGTAEWTQPDSYTVTAAASTAAQASH
jgi:Icc-related predicted phosphoesterase